MSGIFDIFGNIADFITNQNALEDAQAETDARKRALDQIKTTSGQYFKPNQYQTPTDISHQNVEIDPAMRQNQLEALGKLQGLANAQAGTQSDYERRQAMMEANRNAQNQQQSIMQNAAARNQGGAGSMMEYLLRNQAGQDASNRSGQLGMQAASNAALERLQAQGMYNQGLSNLRNQDTQLSGQNADIMNKFNILNAERARDVSMKNTDLQNQAQQINYGRDVNTFNQNMQKWGAAAGPHGETMTNIGGQGKNLSQFMNNNTKWLNNMGNMVMGMGGGGGGAGGGMGGGAMSGMGDFGGTGASAGGGGGGFMSNPYVQMAMKNSNKGGGSSGGGDNEMDNTWNWYG